MKINKLILASIALFAMTSEMKANTTEPSESLQVWASPLTLVNDGETISTLTIYEQDDVDFTAFNMAIVVPEGITIARVKQGREWVDDIHLTDRATSSHTITCGMPNPTTIKIISASPSLASYFPTTEDGEDPYALFTIGLIADPTLEPGEYEIQLCDVKFVLESADAFVLPEEPLTFPITIEDFSTGIKEMGEEKGSGDKYDLNGYKLPSKTTKGVYIQNGRKILSTTDL